MTESTSFTSQPPLNVSSDQDLTWIPDVDFFVVTLNVDSPGRISIGVTAFPESLQSSGQFIDGFCPSPLNMTRARSDSSSQTALGRRRSRSRSTTRSFAKLMPQPRMKLRNACRQLLFMFANGVSSPLLFLKNGCQQTTSAAIRILAPDSLDVIETFHDRIVEATTMEFSTLERFRFPYRNGQSTSMLPASQIASTSPLLRETKQRTAHLHEGGESSQPHWSVTRT